jgi:hypothetical protein
MGLLAIAAALIAGAGMHLPRLPMGRPRGYYRHIPKNERKGKTWTELRVMRQSAPEGVEEER